MSSIKNSESDWLLKPQDFAKFKRSIRSEVCPVLGIKLRCFALIWFPCKRRLYTWRSKGSKILCQVISDLHEWHNDFHAVSNFDPMKLNLLWRCSNNLVRREDPINLYYKYLLCFENSIWSVKGSLYLLLWDNQET